MIKRTTGLHITALTLLVLASLYCAGCSSVTSSDAINTNRLANHNGAAMKEQPQATAIKVDPAVVAANTRFGFKLYSEVLKDKQALGKNVFVSPSSVALALAMAYNGAEAETRQAMASAMEIDGRKLEDVNRAYKDLRAALESADPKVQLQIANSIWSRQGLALKPDFVKRTRESFNAEVSELNFDDPASASIINKWVSGSTNGKIEKIVDQIERDSLMFLINAIYFKGKWSDQFDKARTKDQPFKLADGRQKPHPMMVQSGNYAYFEGEGFQAASLPYGGGRVSMYIFLPREGTSLDQFHRQLKAENWDSWMTSFEKTPGEIALPRFKLEYDISLNDALKALGMGLAFDPDRANFSGMFEDPRDAFISKVKHKTFVEVNEEGTEAAAVTSVEVQATSARMPREPFRMVVDRPFFCAIRDNDSGAVLFMGSIIDPQ